MNILFFLTCCLLLFIQFHWTTCDVEEEHFDELDNVTSTTVQLGISDDKIEQCIFELWDASFDPQRFVDSFLLYDKSKSFIRNDWLKFTGYKDNSCSFIIIPELLNNTETKNNLLSYKWAITEIYCTPTFFQKIFGSCQKNKDIISNTTRNPSYK